MKSVKAGILVMIILLLSNFAYAAIPTATIREVLPTEKLELALCLDLDTYHVTPDEELSLPMYVRNPLQNTSVQVNYFFIDSDAFDYSFQPSSIKELKPQEVRVVTLKISPKDLAEYESHEVLITADCLFYDLIERTHYPGLVSSTEKIFVIEKFKNLRIIIALVVIFLIAFFITMRKRWIILLNKKFKKRKFEKTKHKISQKEIDAHIEKKLQAKKLNKVKKVKKKSSVSKSKI